MPDKQHIHKGHRERLRERAKDNSLEAFQEHEVLELVLSYILPRIDTNPIAHKLIDEFGNLANVLDAKQADLSKISGIGDRATLFLHLIPQILKAYKKSKLVKGALITTPTQVFNYLGNVINYIPHEEFYMLCLDSNSRIITSKLIATGTNNQVNFNLKEVTQIALQTSSCGVILVHNHPTGSNEPSQADIDLTKKIYLSLSLNGIAVMDHLIISRNDYYSFNKNNLFKLFDNQYKNLLNLEALMQKAPKYEV